MTKRNVYPGPCTACDERVAAYQGTLSRVDNKWAVTHDRCPKVEAAEREAEHVARQARYDAALAELAALDFTPVELVELRVLDGCRGNSFVAQKAAIVRASSSLDEALSRISQSCQGMTMDYMTEFCRESDAANLARDLAEAIFASVEVAV